MTNEEDIKDDSNNDDDDNDDTFQPLTQPPDLMRPSLQQVHCCINNECHFQFANETYCPPNVTSSLLLDSSSLLTPF